MAGVKSRAQLLVSTQLDPNDPQYSDVASPLMEHTHASARHGIHAPEAWNLTTGSTVVVAMLDTGVDYTHPDRPERLSKWARVRRHAGG